jgi:hypothetical protein
VTPVWSCFGHVSCLFISPLHLHSFRAPPLFTPFLLSSPSLVLSSSCPFVVHCDCVALVGFLRCTLVMFSPFCTLFLSDTDQVRCAQSLAGENPAQSARAGPACCFFGHSHWVHSVPRHRACRPSSRDSDIAVAGKSLSDSLRVIRHLVKAGSRTFR